MRIACALLVCGLSLTIVPTAQAGPLRAGAARVDITPPPTPPCRWPATASRTQGFKGIHDHVYVRAIVLDDGATQAAIVAWESLFVPDVVWATTSKRIADETGIRPEYLLLSAVHDHGAPTLAPAEPTPQRVAYRTSVENAAVEAVRRARSAAAAARDSGSAPARPYVNVNRREFSAGRGWWLGYNDEGPSDKTVTVLRFDDLTGKPIAFWINYPVHAVVMGPENYQITGDIAGATSRFVEQHYLGNDRPRSDMGMRLRLRPEEKGTGEGAIALWTSGAAGDQNPVSTTNGEDFTLVDGLGKILGEAAVRAAANIKTTPMCRCAARTRS